MPQVLGSTRHPTHHLERAQEGCCKSKRGRSPAVDVDFNVANIVVVEVAVAIAIAVAVAAVADIAVAAVADIAVAAVAGIAVAAAAAVALACSGVHGTCITLGSADSARWPVRAREKGACYQSL
jgi:hypothetical protein